MLGLSVASSTAGRREHTTRPLMTGSSVLGIVYDKGVLLAADTLLSYGSMARIQNVPRLKALDHAHCIIGASGDYSDYQELCDLLERKALEEHATGLIDDSLYQDKKLTAVQIWNYLRFVMYNRRNKFNPYWNELVVAGTYRDDDSDGNSDGTSTTKVVRPFLGTIDKIGTTVRDENVVATGFGSYLALPLLREKWRPNMTEGEARALLEDALKILFFRDCRASARVQLAKAEVPAITTTEGIDDETVQQQQQPIYLVSDPYDLEIPTEAWTAPSMIASTGNLDDDGACGF